MALSILKLKTVLLDWGMFGFVFILELVSIWLFLFSNPHDIPTKILSLIAISAGVIYVRKFERERLKILTTILPNISRLIKGISWSSVLPYIFLTGLILVVYANYPSLPLANILTSAQGYLVAITFATGFGSFWLNRERITQDVEAESAQEELAEEERRAEFPQKFPRLNKIPIVKNLARWMYKEGWFYSITLILVTTLFLIFGLNHLGQFMSVDEPKWVNTRVPQLFEALKNRDWEGTYINDKPGILPAFLSGAVNLFLDHDTYKINPLEYEKYLFFWRLPIVLFNFLMLFFIYHFTKKLLKKDHSLLITGLISLNPILIGISQIVNPDATLWSVGFLSFTTFFLYLKTNSRKYIYYSGLFLGLALVSKYFASIFYIIFFTTIYFEYLFNQTSQKQFFSRILDVSLLYIVSIIIYSLLFPAMWVNPSQAIKGTVGSGILLSGRQYFNLFLVLIFVELILLRGKITNYLKTNFNLGKIIIFLFSLIFFTAFTILLINIIFNNLFFNFNEYLQTEFIKDFSISLKTTLVSGYSTLFTLTYPILIGIILFPIIIINQKTFAKLQNKILLATAVYSSVIVFFVGAFLGGYIINARYQILLYPLLSFPVSLFILTISKHKLLTITVISSLCFSIIYIQPLSFLYTNNLNIRKYLITDMWGFGGYELAQQLNKLPGAENINVWIDREGFSEFFIGKSYWRGKNNPFDDNIDYLILTQGGERIFTSALKNYNKDFSNLYSTISKETPLLEYYKKKSLFEVCLKNENNCTRAVKVERPIIYTIN